MIRHKRTYLTDLVPRAQALQDRIEAEVRDRTNRARSNAEPMTPAQIAVVSAAFAYTIGLLSGWVYWGVR